MRIIQIAYNDNTDSYRYSKELNTALNLYTDNNITYVELSDYKEFNQPLMNVINTYDIVFIHFINDDKFQYVDIAKTITIKKVLFITNINKVWSNMINLSYIHILLNNVDYIAINNGNTELINTVSNIIGQDRFNKKHINLDYIYNFNVEIDTDNKKNTISLFAQRGLITKYDMFIDIFKNREHLTQEFIWNIYGAQKNIQTLSINDLYINSKTNATSKITNFNINVIEKDKINVYPEPLPKLYKDDMFICCFDNLNYINYSIIDIITNCSIPIFYSNYAKQIKINKSQSLYDIRCGIYIDDALMDNINTIIQINKYLISKNTYKAFIINNIKIFKQLFNPEKAINNLITSINEGGN